MPGDEVVAVTTEQSRHVVLVEDISTSGRAVHPSAAIRDPDREWTPSGLDVGAELRFLVDRELRERKPQPVRKVAHIY